MSHTGRLTSTARKLATLESHRICDDLIKPCSDFLGSEDLAFSPLWGGPQRWGSQSTPHEDGTVIPLSAPRRTRTEGAAHRPPGALHPPHNPRFQGPARRSCHGHDDLSEAINTQGSLCGLNHVALKNKIKEPKSKFQQGSHQEVECKPKF